jgi:hypothetical protein
MAAFGPGPGACAPSVSLGLGKPAGRGAKELTFPPEARRER